MANQCPNCDQPLRSGAKFCTSCGHRLEEAKPTPPAPAAPSPHPKPQQAQRLSERSDGTEEGKVPCPKCGKSNRKGVKFCRYCGGSMALAPVESQRNRARVVTVSFFVLVILMVCISLVGIGWGLGVDQWLFPTATPSAGGSLLPYWVI